MIPPAILALGAGSLVCALTASVLGRPAPSRHLSEEEREALLGVVPRGETVRIEAVDEAAALALLTAKGRQVEEGTVFTVRGLAGTGLLHVARVGGHSLLVLGEPDILPPGQPPPVMG